MARGILNILQTQFSRFKDFVVQRSKHEVIKDHHKKKEKLPIFCFMAPYFQIVYFLSLFAFYALNTILYDVKHQN